MPTIINPVYLNYPYRYFKYVYTATKNANGTFALGTKENSGEYVYDNISNGTTDSNAQIGDVAGDQYRALTPSSKFGNVATFVGGTADHQSFIGRYTGGSSQYNGKYYFYSNTKPKAAAKAAEAVFAADSVQVCYASGTRIRTVDGDVAVELLRVGDSVVTLDGAQRPIRWLGHRLVNCRTHPRPAEAMPVRVTAHAFGENRPARDLVVSPGHSLCVDVVGEVLIPAGALVNGSTVRVDEVDTINYWHVELDSHDILIAENLAAESYLEMENRSFFAENGVIDLDASPGATIVTHADFCRPFHVEGALVDAVRAQLSVRAGQLGWRLEMDALGAGHLVVDGQRVEPQLRDLTARFTVPAGAQQVWLVSRTSVPAEVAASPDRRALGLYVDRLVFDDGYGAPTHVAGDDPRLCVGFHDPEASGCGRWTAGRALLPAELWNGMEGEFFLRVDLAGPALPLWAAPARVEERVRAPLALIA